MLDDFYRAFVRVHVLHHAAQEPIYGMAMLEELRRHGYDIGPGVMYPLLHDLERAGYLTREERVVGGKVRKYYAITGAGQAALEEARAKIAELVEEVLEGRGPVHLPEPPTDDEKGAIEA